jgi:acyl carrier protein
MTGVTFEEVRAFILEDLVEPLAELGLSPEEISDDFDLLTSGVIDSLGLLELIAEVNERFGLDIDYEELDPEGLTIVGPFSRHVARVSTATVTSRAASAET